ncbi:MAG: sugar phosphate isomerase/epimerase family protein [Planctomycetota bacterium]|nr:sugar phosphate isomerase/epimerase family protein [Planctomycetota bacterium]
MTRPITIFTGQWADLPLDDVASFAASCGYEGLELACWGDHFDVHATSSELKDKQSQLASHSLECWAISNHLVGQAVCDEIDERHKAILPESVWGDGDPEGVRQRSAEEMKQTASAAAAFGVPVVNGFTGSSIWGKFYFFPPTPTNLIDDGFVDFRTRWLPILDEFEKHEVKFALEVHPAEIAYDIVTAQRALEAVDFHPAFGFNFDPSHLLWQGVDPSLFLDTFSDYIFHVHVKDVTVQLDGERSILGSHLPFGDHRRGWEFRSVGRGDVDFDGIIRTLNRIGYDGPLSVEWEDEGMDRHQGAAESIDYLQSMDVIPPSGEAFDAAFSEKAGD